jgi:fructoselysine-6-P-deglycase FrlB-like protein
MNALNTALMAETAADIDARVDPRLIERLRARIDGPLAVVASGGSFTAATLWAHLHESAGHPAWAMTPYAFRQRALAADVRVLLLSAGGHHHDILSCAAVATERGHDTRAVCRTPSPLAELVGAAGSPDDVLGMPETLHADGMIAVHALVGLAVLAARVYGGAGLAAPGHAALSAAQWTTLFGDDAVSLPAPVPRFVIAFGAGAAEPAAVDFANKCQETGLAPAWQTDVRHFAHGQFMMLHGGRPDMLLLAFATGSQRAYLERFAATIAPATMLRRIEVETEGAAAALALLARGMRTFEQLAARIGGQPTIAALPTWGRALYELEV